MNRLKMLCPLHRPGAGASDNERVGSGDGGSTSDVGSGSVHSGSCRGRGLMFKSQALNEIQNLGRCLTSCTG